jgi:hypothetical protein
MNKITTYNYEAFLLDYWEGNLPAEDVAELLLFINNNPVLNIELNDLPNFEPLDNSLISADFKYNLKKSADDVKERFNELCIEFYNKTITAENKIALDLIIKEFPNLEIEFKYFGITYLKPDLDVFFQNKSVLQKSFIPTNSFEYKAIQYLENETSSSEKEKFEKDVAENDELKIELNKYKKTKLVDVDIIFEHKNKLYKTENKKGIIPIWMRYAAAAAIFISAGIYFVNTDTKDKNGIASIRPDTRKSIRTAKNNAQELDTTFEKQLNIPNKKRVVPKSIIQENTITAEPLITLRHKVKVEIKEPFVLETEYMANISLPSLELNETAELTNNNEISSRNLFIKKIKKILKKKNIDLDTPIESIKEDGLAESSIKGLELITNGAVSVQRENTENGRRYKGFSIGSLSYSRSNSK